MRGGESVVGKDGTWHSTGGAHRLTGFGDIVCTLTATRALPITLAIALAVKVDIALSVPLALAVAGSLGCAWTSPLVLVELHLRPRRFSVRTTPRRTLPRVVASRGAALRTVAFHVRRHARRCFREAWLLVGPWPCRWRLSSTIRGGIPVCGKLIVDSESRRLGVCTR